MIFLENNKNIDFLNTIYKTSEMGVVGINDVIDKVSKENFRDYLNEQREEYNKIMKKTESLFTSFGMKEKELSTFTKVNSKVMSEMKLMTNSSDETIAKMMMEGTNKGVIKINKTINENNGIDPEALSLAEELLEIMEHNLEELKIYL